MQASTNLNTTVGRTTMSKHDKPAGVTSTQAVVPLGPAAEYIADAAQRTLLFCDVLRQRGNQ